MRATTFGSLWVPLVAVVALTGALASLRPPLQSLWGDEGTYLAMTVSLVRDGDLAFEEADRTWAEEREPGVGATVIVQQTERGLSYSKPVVYPILAAPFYWLFGERGLVALNAIALTIALLLAWNLLGRRGPSELSTLTVLSYAGCGALLPYLLWRVSDLLQFSLVLAGLVLVCQGLRHPGGRVWPLWAAALGATGLGLAAHMRLTNAALAAAAAVACALVGRWRRSGTVAGAAAGAFLAATLCGVLLTGTANPYKAVRTSFNGEIGYPAGPGAEQALERFSIVPATQSATWTPGGDSSRSLYASLYFVLGRHSGLLLYFPIALLLVYRLLRHPDRVGLALLGGVAAMVCFYLLWLPWNYFGGATFVGNRYFLTSYAALLVAAPGLPSGRQLVPAWLIAAAVGLSALYSVESARALDPMSQNHAYTGIFRFFPYESTAIEIDGQRDRYWAGDFLRFVDPNAEVGDFSFELDSEMPAAEILLATTWPGSRPRFLVTSDSEPLELRVSDWGRRRWLPLDSNGDRTRSVVELDLSRSWRRHLFWWSPEALYNVHSFSLTLLPRNSVAARAKLRYLGDGGLLDRAPEREVLSVAVTEAALADEVSEAQVRVRNTSGWSWSSDDVLPVFLSYRLRAPDGVTIEGPRLRVEPAVEPGDVLEQRLPLAWPDTPGTYHLRIDLVIESVSWFEDRLGEPIFATTLEVESPPPG